MAQYTDSNSYAWSVPDDQFDTSTDPYQLDAGQGITVTAPSGESNNWCVNNIYQVTDPNDLSTALAAAFNDQGTQGYPITATEQAFIDNCNKVIDDLNSMINTATSVGADAEAVAEWVKKAAEVACALVWIPIVGTAIAAIGAGVLAVDLKVENCIDALMGVAQQAAQTDFQLQDLRDKVSNHWDKGANVSVMLQDAENTLTQIGNNAMNFWQALEQAVKNCTAL
jgi:hypothetical protein